MKKEDPDYIKIKQKLKEKKKAERKLMFEVVAPSLAIVLGICIILIILFKVGLFGVLKTGLNTGRTSETASETVSDSAIKKFIGIKNMDGQDSAKRLTNSFQKKGPYTEDGVSYYYRTGKSYIEIYDGKNFVPVFMKGVNLGVGKPWYFPGELAITKEEYLRWFQEISDMNANCIRVYTVQNPDFYEAFYDFNTHSPVPLFLFHGTWYNEDILLSTNDAFDKNLRNELYKEEMDIIDIIHGNCTIEPRPGHASGEYTWDISPWCIGWILGIESDAAFVGGTNEKHPEKTSYNGTYFNASDVSPFEVFWAETSDEIVKYEMDKYGMQRPLTYTNWPTTDIMKHPSESHPSETMNKEDAFSLNIENIVPTDKYKAGIFASYHIYSYYPNFMYTDKDYSSYVDEDGEVNTYMAYLKDLISHSNIPIMVGEFGIPTCKGLTHTNTVTGFNQGNVDEKKQGEILAHMMEDIKDAGYAGGLIFTWQDEWFKRTWNTMDYTDSDRRAYWNDVMTNEQHFGLLDFVPGDGDRSKVVLDGESSDWNLKARLISHNGIDLSATYDCAFLYLMLQSDGTDWDHKRVTIPIDVTPLSGSSKYNDLVLEREADFVLVLDGKDNSNLYVQEYYDRFPFTYRKYSDIIPEFEAPVKNGSKFGDINYLLERQLKLADRDETIPLRVFNAGKQLYGTTDYEAEEYNSIADFYYKGNTLEIRIPWQLLNFRDPSTKEIEDDFWNIGDFAGKTIDQIYIGMTDNDEGKVEFAPFTWDNWENYPYFERLRKSYYIIQDLFSRI